MSARQAQLLRQWSPQVTFVTGGSEVPDETRAELIARGISVDDRPVAGVVADASGALRAIEFTDGAGLDVDVIFLHTAVVPNDALLVDLGAARSENQGALWVDVDDTGRTSVPGAWAVGNVANPSANVPVSLAVGAVAAATINADLVQEEIRGALEASS